MTLLFLGTFGGCSPSAELIDENGLSFEAAESIIEQTAPSEIDWAQAPDCRSKLRLLQEGLVAGTIGGLENTPFTLISDQPLARLAGWPGVDQQGLQGGYAGAEEATKPCAIRVGEMHEHKAEHRVLGRERIRSSYQSGSHMEKNPAYEAAQARLRQAEKASKPGKSSIISVGDPLIDLFGTLIGGAITGVGQWGQGDQVEEAIDALMATPRSIEHPKYRSYHFERTNIRASREAVIPVTMTDRRLQQSWRISLKRREIRDLAILDGLDRQDRDYANYRESSMTDQAFRQWQDEPPELPLDDMIASLLTAPVSSSIDRIASLKKPADQREKPQADAGSGDDNFFDAAALPRASFGEPVIAGRQTSRMLARSEAAATASVVQIVDGDQRGQGVYVAPVFVLTTSDLVVGRGLIDVENSDGGSVLGLVATVDRSRGLALIQVPRPGRAAILNDESGHLAGSRDLSSHDRKNVSVNAGGRLIAQDKSRSDADLAHHDGPILKGNLLLGFRSKHGPDISAQEIKAFLKEQDDVLVSHR